jgi:pyruvate/2-oxoacid:ferredoxin oxidoreductase alpha subunit
MVEAVRIARAAGHRVSSLTIQSLWPVPEAAILRALRDEAGEMAAERVVVAELNLGDFCREVERVIYTWAARNRRVAPSVDSLHRFDGEMITPAQFLEAL